MCDHQCLYFWTLDYCSAYRLSLVLHLTPDTTAGSGRRDTQYICSWSKTSKGFCFQSKWINFKAFCPTLDSSRAVQTPDYREMDFIIATSKRRVSSGISMFTLTCIMVSPSMVRAITHLLPWSSYTDSVTNTSHQRGVVLKRLKISKSKCFAQGCYWITSFK